MSKDEKRKQIETLVSAINEKSAKKGNKRPLITCASNGTVGITPKWFPCGIPQVDKALGGGFPQGAITSIHGTWGSGKTFLAMTVAAELTKQGKYVLYVNLEGMFLDLFVEKLGLDLNYVYHINPKDHGDEIVDVIEGMLWDKATRTPRDTFDCVIIDSITNFVAKANVDKLEKDGAEGGQKVGARATLIDQMLTRMYGRGVLADQIIILIAQDRAVISQNSKGPETEMSGGNAPKYDSKVIIKLAKKRTNGTINSRSVSVGHTVLLTVEKNSLNGKFGEIADYSVKYGEGIDDSAALVQKALLPEWAYIIPGEKRGTFLILTEMGDVLVKGKKVLEEVVRVRSDIAAYLRKVLGQSKPKTPPQPTGIALHVDLTALAIEDTIEEIVTEETE